MVSRLAVPFGFALALQLGAPAPAAAQTGTPGTRWVVDPVHSQVDFRVRHLLGRVRGTFTKYYAVLETHDSDWTDGTVKVTRSGKTLRELGAGDFIGEIALVVDRPRTATVTATSPVRLLVVTDRAFSRLLEQVPSISLKVMQSLGERLHADAL